MKSISSAGLSNYWLVPSAPTVNFKDISKPPAPPKTNTPTQIYFYWEHEHSTPELSEQYRRAHKGIPEWWAKRHPEQLKDVLKYAIFTVLDNYLTGIVQQTTYFSFQDLLKHYKNKLYINSLKAINNHCLIFIKFHLVIYFINRL